MPMTVWLMEEISWLTEAREWLQQVASGHVIVLSADLFSLRIEIVAPNDTNLQAIGYNVVEVVDTRSSDLETM